LISTGIFIIPKFKQSVKREFLNVAREWAGRVKRNCIGGAFRKAKYEIRRRRNPRSRTLCVRYGARSEGGQKFLPPNLLPFCPPKRKSFSKFSVGIFFEKSSDFVQDRQNGNLFHTKKKVRVNHIPLKKVNLVHTPKLKP